METLSLYELKKIQTNFKNEQIDSPEKASDFIRQFYGDDLEIFESFFILLLNQAQNTIGYAKISQGGIVGTVVDFRLVAKYAIESLAVNVIIAHNHPSGNLTPSPQDLAITEKIKKGLDVFDIRLNDHIILTKDGFTSFSNKGIL
ncbi:MAG: hypothetical protein RLZZ414_1375 [Bacteroidota bacterium]|jgi:DNA repair protein RadC